LISKRDKRQKLEAVTGGTPCHLYEEKKFFDFDIPFATAQRLSSSPLAVMEWPLKAD
jgi:hypothetical protein